MAIMINVSDKSIVMATRAKAEELTRDIESTLTQSSDSIILDFSRVNAVSPSFADELFRRLEKILWTEGRARELGIITASEAVQETLQVVLSRRLLTSPKSPIREALTVKFKG